MKVTPFLVLALLLFACKPKPQNAEWRGKNHAGIYTEANLLKSWPDDGPELIWETEEIGNGYSSAILSDEFAFVTGEIDSLGYLFKFDHHGNELWRVSYGKEWTTNFPGSRGTPTLSNGLVYVCSGLGDLACLDASTGEKRWSKHLITDFEGVCPRFGFSQSPLVDDGKLICIPGGPEHNIIALNAFSGELVWSASCFGERPAYNSPIIIDRGGKKIILAFSAYHFLGLNMENGALLWSHEQTNTKPEERGPGMGDTHGNPAIFDHGSIYYVAGDGNGGVKLELSDDGNQITEGWVNPEGNNFLGGIVQLGDTIYGGIHSKKQLIAIDCHTGAKTDSLEIGGGSLVSADSMLYYYTDQGAVHLVSTAGEKMKSVSSFKIKKGTKEHFAHPSLKNGILYLRHGNYLGAFNVSNK